MNRLLCCLVMLAATTAATAQEQTLQEVSWPALQAAGKVSTGTIVQPNEANPWPALKLVNDNDQPRTFTLTIIENPRITAQQYAVKGQVRYEQVADVGYLEMWSCFSDDSKYFSRTLADSGPLGSIQGTSDWRPFALPFHRNNNASARPIRLEINLVLPGKGTVFLGPLTLVQQNAWWTQCTAGLIGGIGGAAVGILGGLVGILAGLGKARRLVMGLLVFMMAAGLAGAVAALIAALTGQPYHVWYPLALSLILTLVCGCCLGAVRRRFQWAELRKMQALDATQR